MGKTKIEVGILPNQFLKSDGTFDKDSAIMLSGKIAGVCYDQEGFNHLVNEPVSRTLKRVDMTLNNGHHSVYDHITINFNLQNLPKILAMVINNEHQYTTSEKSARYTRIVSDSKEEKIADELTPAEISDPSPITKADSSLPIVEREGSAISEDEVRLYNKWMEIFKIKIKARYGDFYNDSKITKLAQENARYMVTVFMPTQMIYTTSLRQINYIVSWMQEYINEADMNDRFQRDLSDSMQQLIDELGRLNVLEDGLLHNEKHRKLSLFGENLAEKEIFFGDVYSTNYLGSFAEFAQAQRHRTLDYQLELMDEPTFFVPPIIENDPVLVEEWLEDLTMESNKDIYPQGQAVIISEMGKYDDFILKCKERLCSAAQLEIMYQTRATLLQYQEALQERNHRLAYDIEKYTHGARCTFPDFTCTDRCNFKEGITLTRKI